MDGSLWFPKSGRYIRGQVLSGSGIVCNKNGNENHTTAVAGGNWSNVVEHRWATSLVSIEWITDVKWKARETVSQRSFPENSGIYVFYSLAGRSVLGETVLSVSSAALGLK